MNRLAFVAARVRDSFWFVPAVAIVLAVVLAESVVVLDRALDIGGLLIIDVGPDGARGLLAAIATSMLAAAATMFSITIAVLALTASAYGPRLVRNFMSDRGNQLVLATLVSTALYALLVLRRVRSGDDEFVPSVGVSLALGLTVLCIALLIYFIHHISTGIQISTLAGGVRVELAARMLHNYPECVADDRRPDALWPLTDGTDHEIRARSDGYVADIGESELVAAARSGAARIDLLVRPGTFVCHGDLVATVALEDDHSARAPVDERVSRVESAVRSAVAVRDERTPYQDVEHLARQLVDIAARAISPGINDPYTAVAAIDALTAAFAGTAGHADPSPVVVDADAHPRLRLAQRRWIDVVTEAVDAIRVYSTGQPIVAERLLDLLERLASRSRDAHRRLDLVAAADRVLRGADSDALLPEDRDRLRAAATWTTEEAR
ncbi:DUF2254 domain-containing protein [Microcella sp.]|uniref:DUF2254 domain-containing protein n=1 Tax=Microcella sp. TaxID=1913979 RepID=UPI00255F77C6|nr:DUF2254 domain-containing protein [Microcella sp.]MBX9473060.1 DUF2254 domain-containing protein [Microcella sp.]